MPLEKIISYAWWLSQSDHGTGREDTPPEEYARRAFRAVMGRADTGDDAGVVALVVASFKVE